VSPDASSGPGSQEHEGPSSARGALTLAFTDIEGSSALAERHCDAYETARRTHVRLLRGQLERFGGTAVKGTGDGLFLVFARSAQAVAWAVEAQRALVTHPWPEPVGRLSARIGLHSGELYSVDTSGAHDYHGPAVNRAARIAGAAHGGQILISDAVRVLAAPGLPEGVSLRDMGCHRLAGVGEERIWQVVHPALPADFPALVSLNPERHNLPVALTPMIGRQEEIARWYRQITGPVRLLTLTGFGGIGKTRTALQLAELCVGAFEHGAWWVDLDAAVGVDDLLLRVAQTLRLDVAPEAPLLEQIGSFMRDRELLLVLDNSETVRDADAVVLGLLAAAAKLRILLTSRRALGVRGETVAEVRALPTPAAVQLFVERARACRDDFELVSENEGDVGALCTGLEAVPLAIELAAARVAVLTPRQMLARLREGLQLLQTRSTDLPPRQRALRATIDWSYRLLEPDDQVVFAQLAVFANGFTLEDAEAVCTGADVLESVLELRRSSLLRAETDPMSQHDHFSMFEALRAYGSELARQLPDHEDLRDRHAHHFLAVGREHVEALRTPHEPEALRALIRAEPNLRAALAWAAEREATDLHAGLGLLLGRLLFRMGYSAQAVEPIKTSAERLAGAPGQYGRLHCELLLELAGLRLDLGAPQEAEALSAQVLELAEHRGDPALAGQIENLRGQAAMDAGDFAAARDHLGSALARAQAAQGEALAGIIHNNLGLVERRDPGGDQVAAERHMREALRIRRSRGDSRGLAETLNNLGVLAYDRGDWEAARLFYTDALEHERVIGHLYGIGCTLSNLGEVARELGEAERACRLFAAAARVFEDTGCPAIATPVGYLKEVARATGLSGEAWRAEARSRPSAVLPEWALGAVTTCGR
jgi:predicted ATPase/class 3 adenylate cyclase/Tfp pilus assembly protein PilF